MDTLHKIHQCVIYWWICYAYKCFNYQIQHRQIKDELATLIIQLKGKIVAVACLMPV